MSYKYNPFTGRLDVVGDECLMSGSPSDFYTKAQLDGGQLDNRYYTETEIGNLYYTKTAINNFDFALYTELVTTSGDIVSQFPTDFYTTSQVDTISGTLNDKLNTHKSSADHDSRYYTESEIDAQWITHSGTIDHDTINNTHNLTTNIDHGSISGLNDDDHTMYMRTDGLRGFVSTVSGITPVDTSHLVTKGYVDGLVLGLNWQGMVLSKTTEYGDAAASGTNRYIAPSTSGTWTVDNIYEWTGATWSGTTALEDMAAWVDDEQVYYIYNGTDWIKFSSSVTGHNSLGGLQGGQTNEYYHLTNTQHNALTDLGGVGDATSQHIHDGRYYTESEIDTISGTLNSKLDTHKSSSDHDGRYYTESEIDTLITTTSGDLQTNIDAKIGAAGVTYENLDANGDVGTTANTVASGSHTHTSSAVTDFEEAVEDIMGIAIVGAGSVSVSYDDGAGTITVSGTSASGSGTSNHSELNELDYASAGHTGFASTALLTTTSGDLQTNIDGKADSSHTHSGSDITSGNISIDRISTALSGFGANTISGTGDIYAGSYYGDGSHLTGISGTGGATTKYSTTTVTSGTTNVTTGDFGETFVMTGLGNCTFNLPSVDAGDLGAWFRFAKDYTTSGTLTIDAADADIIADSSAGGTIYNDNVSETYATITIQLMNTVQWSITGAHGSWTTT